MTDPYAPLNIDPRQIIIGDFDPGDWVRFSPRDQRILRGGFAGRLLPLKKGRTAHGVYLPSWPEMFLSAEEAQHALGEAIFENDLRLTVDLVNVRMYGAHCFQSMRRATSYHVMAKAEALLREMPARFTWSDLVAAKAKNLSTIARAHIHGFAATIYLHIVAGNIEYIPNVHAPSNPSFRKISPFLFPADKIL